MAGDREPADRSALKSLSRDVRMVSENREGLDLHNSIAIIALFTSIAAWKGSAGITEDEKEEIRSIISCCHTSIVISFGNPYVLRYFSKADLLIAAYESTDQVQKTIVTWLTEAKRLEGRIPVKLSF
jgi:hypothetical protein